MRLFIAIRFGEDFTEALCRYQTMLGALGRASWTAWRNLHLTLAFIGEQDGPDPAIRALETVRFEPFAFELAGPLRFDTARCVGVRDGGRTAALAGSVRRALGEAGIPFDPKPMKPHITVARRFRRAEGVTEADLGALMPETAAETASSFWLMRSEQKDGRLVYTPLWEKKADPSRNETGTDLHQARMPS